MGNITTKGIQKSFGGKTVLASIDFTLAEGKKTALIGQNGSGKSTLLKILSGEIKPDGGQVFGAENACVYIAQDFSGSDQETPYEFLRRKVSEIPSAIRLFEEAGFDLGKDQNRLHSVRCGNLSGGEKKKLEIVSGLASGALFIALDEPENHLDYQTIEWLIGVLMRFNGGLVFVSHDQYFINQLADSILELEDGVLMVYSLKYEEYLVEKERQATGQTRQWIMEGKTIQRLRKTVEMMKVRAARSSGTAATYQQTKRKFNEVRERHDTTRKPTAEPDRPKVTLDRVEQKKGKLIASVEHMAFSYGNHRIFKDADAELRFGEKVVLFGRNGSGKSTLVQLLTGELLPQVGFARIGVNVRWQLMSQDHLMGLDATQSPLDIFRKAVQRPEHYCRSQLAKYGIGINLVTRPLEILSGGQRARFKLALTFAQDPEFLILDEPTNHVDPPTWETIVDAIKEYSGTVLAITHDRFFIDSMAEKLWVVQNGKIRVELGNVSDYLSRITRKK